MKYVYTGGGASCVYPLLGAKKNGWQYLVSEADPTNYEYASRNVQKNSLGHKIKGKHHLGSTCNTCFRSGIKFKGST